MCLLVFCRFRKCPKTRGGCLQSGCLFTINHAVDENVGAVKLSDSAENGTGRHFEISIAKFLSMLKICDTRAKPLGHWSISLRVLWCARKDSFASENRANDFSVVCCVLWCCLIEF